ncbi:hypothetical protein FZEAL_6638 [Fusarium zealandicum]|uniref:BZIP domain-containing protein n=1 Tax=Fusarium zealandicum TaxID=1053134 RepID=A0A8H4UHD4_9HYPO|nr:hypothetical protein FZEAL_6638 [Fusarium zealandicum]
MCPPNNDWTNITDVNERRKAQNRVAQRNYRSRQKLRVELAEAILYDLPQVRSAVRPKGRRWLTGRHADSQEKADGPTGSACVGPAGISNDKEYSRQRTDPLSLDDTGGGRGGRGSLGAAADENLAHLDAFPMHNDTGALPELDLGAFDTSTDCIDPALQEMDWMEIGSAWSSRPMAAEATEEVEVEATAAASKAASPDSYSSPRAGQVRNLPDQTSTNAGAAVASTRQPPPTAAPLPLPITVAPRNLTNRNAPQAAAGVSPSSSTGSAPVEPRTPVMTAISRGKLEIARLLIRSGAKIDVPDLHGRTHLHLAIERGDFGMARSLLELGADALATDTRGMAALHMAVERDAEEMARLLLEWCKDRDRMASESDGGLRQDGAGRGDLLQRCVNFRDGENMTPVHLCVVLERLDILKVLLHYGADVNIGCPLAAKPPDSHPRWD